MANTFNSNNQWVADSPAPASKADSWVADGPKAANQWTPDAPASLGPGGIDMSKVWGAPASIGGTPSNYVTPAFANKKVPGMLQPGNIDLNARPDIKNSDGTHSSVYSTSSNIDGKEVLYPGVGDGVTYPYRRLTQTEALNQYRKTGKHLGIFDTPQSSDAYAQQLHLDQAKMPVVNGILRPSQSPIADGSVPKPSTEFMHPMTGATALFHLPNGENDADKLNPRQKQYLALKNQAQMSNSPDAWKRLMDFQTKSGITLDERQDAAGANPMPFDVLHGVGEMARGGANLVATPNVKGNIPEASAAGSQILNGAMEAGMPFLPIELAHAPLKTLGALGEGYLASNVVGGVANQLHADPRTQGFLSSLGMFIPSAANIAEGHAERAEEPGLPTSRILRREFKPEAKQDDDQKNAQPVAVNNPLHPLDQKLNAVENGFEPAPQEVAAQEVKIIKSGTVPGFENLSDAERANRARVDLKQQDAQKAIQIHAMDTSGVPELQMAARVQAGGANPRVANWVKHLAGEDASMNSPATLLPDVNGNISATVPEIIQSSVPDKDELARTNASVTQSNPVASYRVNNPDLASKEAEMKPVLNKIARINTFLRSDNPEFSAANTEDVTGQPIERLVPQHLTKVEAARLKELTGRRTKKNSSSTSAPAPVASSPTPVDARTALKQYIEDNDLRPELNKTIQRKFKIAYPQMDTSNPDYGVLFNNYVKENSTKIAKDIVAEHSAAQGPKPQVDPDELREMLGEGQLTAGTRQELGIPQRSPEERQEISNLRRKLIRKEGEKLTGRIRNKYLPEWRQELANGGNSTFTSKDFEGLPTRLRNELTKELPNETKPITTAPSETLGRSIVPEPAHATASPETTATTATNRPEKGVDVAQPGEGLNPREITPPSDDNGDRTPPPSGGEPPRFDLPNGPFHDTMDAVNTLINAHPESERWLQPMLDASIRANPKITDQVEAFRKGIKSYHEALNAGDPFALKAGMDAARPSMRLGDKPYTPEELQSINSSVGYARLSKLNNVSPLELADRKEEIWSENLQNIIEESGDPDLAQALKDLKAKVPKTNSVTNGLLGLFRDSIEKQQVDNLHSIIRSTSGTAYRNNEVLQQHLAAFDALLNHLSRPESLRFIARMESGEEQVPDIFNALDPKTQTKWQNKYNETALPDPNDVAQELRRLLDLHKDNVNRASGKLANFYVDYMPHIFENYAKAQAFAKQWVAKTPLEGTTSYLKQRHFAFLEDAVNAGNMPLTFNPVRLATMRMEQMGRFAMAHDIRNKMIEQNLASPFKLGEQPAGWVPLEDKIFEVKQFDPEQGGVINRGQYFAPEAVAKDFNEFIKSGMTGKWTIPYTNLSLYDAARGWAGLANRFQLSFSALHGMETVLNADASELGDAIVRGSYGDYIGAAKGVLNWASIFGPAIRNIYYGNHILANFRDPNKALNYASITSAAEAAGVRLNLDPFFETHELDKLKTNWSKVTSDLPLSNKVASLFKSAFNLVGATIEKTTWPLMNWMIPRAKLGAFAQELKRTQDLNPGASQAFLDREAEKAWDSMDDRFGEFTNSNWFVPQAMKDVLNLTMRSPGWNVGTARQFFGGTGDLAKALANAPSNKMRVRLSSRTAFMIALPLTVAYLDSIYQKLHTGHFPSSAMDYFFPQTGTKNQDGEPNRVMAKSYVGDVINFNHDPALSLFHKAAPEISTMSDIIRNSNYYGREVYDPSSGPLSKLGAVALFAVQNSSTPFSLSNYNERKMRSTDSQLFGRAGLESSVGFLPAPAWVGKTDAENLASKYYGMENPQGIKDEEEMDQKQTFVQLRQKALEGKITGDQLTKALNSSKLKPTQLKYLFRGQNESALEYHTKGLHSMDRKMNIYRVATPEEKQKLLPILERGLATVGPKQQAKIITELGLH